MRMIDDEGTDKQKKRRVNELFRIIDGAKYKRY